MSRIEWTSAVQQPWDIFCQVIDNYGDIGVCWRLAAALAAQGQPVRLRVDDASALQWMAPQGAAGVQVLDYHAPWNSATAPAVVIEGFGCSAPDAYLAQMAALVHQPVLLNLEYLSAEAYVQRCHGLPSPILQGAGQGLTRWFFYPGFVPETGGLLREADLPQRQAAFDRSAWRAQRGLQAQSWVFSLFCYEPAALAPWLQQMAAWPQAQVLATPGRASQALQALWQQQPGLQQRLAVQYLSPCSQQAFDELLWASDMNLVRGEDSLVRALWAGQALVWQIYPQEDNAHHAKLEAFLDWLQAPPSMRQFHYAWNGMAAPTTLPTINPQLVQQWQQCVQAARQRLLSQPDLLAQLQGFVQEKS